MNGMLNSSPECRDVIDRVKQLGIEINSWTSLRSYLDNKFFAYIPLSIVFVPLLIKSFSLIPTGVEFSGQGLIALEMNAEISYSWYSLYFSAFFFLLARLVFSIKCPAFLRAYQDAASAIEDGHTVPSIITDFEEFSSKHLIDRIRTTFRRKGNAYGMMYGSNSFDAALRRLILHFHMEALSWPTARGSRAIFRALWTYQLQRIKAASFSDRCVSSEAFTKDRFSSRSSIGAIHMEKENQIDDLVRDYLSLQNACFPVWRVIVVLLLVPGILLAIVPMIHNFVVVANSLNGGMPPLKEYCEVVFQSNVLWERIFDFLVCQPISR